jgi:hypothetical protein
MDAGHGLEQADTTAFETHFRLTSIHPFCDVNVQTRDTAAVDDPANYDTG